MFYCYFGSWQIEENCVSLSWFELSVNFEAIGEYISVNTCHILIQTISNKVFLRSNLSTFVEFEGV